MKYTWPLNTSQFSWMDRFKIASFILSDDQWTQSKYVHKFEQEMAKYVGVDYAVFTSSGSTANTLLAMMLRDEFPDKHFVVFPTTTWITSVSPFIREGFTPHFIDINMKDLSIDLDKLETCLKENHGQVAAVFVTSLIGLTPNIERLQTLAKTYNVRIMMDNCENTLGSFRSRNVSSFFTSTTSTYFGHQIQSVEGGFVFTNKQHEYEYLLMARNHGMVRSVAPARQKVYANQGVNPRFDFNLLGNNFRNTDINAYIGLLDFQRREKYVKHRRNLFRLFMSYLLPQEFFVFDEENGSEHVPFCLPIIFRNPMIPIKRVIEVCDTLGIETRPIISGNLLRHTCFKYWSAIAPNSDYVHRCGIYAGLHSGVTEHDVQTLASAMNILANNYD